MNVSECMLKIRKYYTFLHTDTHTRTYTCISEDKKTITSQSVNKYPQMSLNNGHFHSLKKEKKKILVY